MTLLFFSSSQALADRYANYSDLAAHERENVSYSIYATDRGSALIVLSIHGGNIERGTSELADLIAAQEYNRYDFRGLLPGRGSFKLHVTSTHFDEPRALDLISRSDRCISIHGYSPRPAGHNICIGGQDSAARERVAARLRAELPANINVIEPCEVYEGTDPLNVVNRCTHTGVQFEISWQLYQRLHSDQNLAQQIALMIRQSMNE